MEWVSQFAGSSEIIYNPFLGTQTRYAIEEDNNNDYFNSSANNLNDGDDNSVRSNHSGASLFSLEDDDNDVNNNNNESSKQNNNNNNNNNSTDNNKADATSGNGKGTTTGGGILTNVNRCRMMISLPIIEAELDLEADERRCLEEIALSGMFSRAVLAPSTGPSSSNRQRHNHQQPLPRYADPVLALRILVECIAKLNRLDDIERMMQEGLTEEIRSVVQREQARTFSRLERMRRTIKTNTAAPIKIRQLILSKNSADI